MKTRTFLSFNAPWPVASMLFADTQCTDLLAAGPNIMNLYQSKFYQDDLRLHALRNALSNAGIEWSERRELVFTQAELEAAPLLWPWVVTAPRDHPGPKNGTEYDLSNACPRCGTGAVQTSPLRLDPIEIPKRGEIFETMDNEILVYLQLARALIDAQISGLELRIAEALKGRLDLPWAQLLAKVQLPPMASTTGGIVRDEPCHLCGRDGYFDSAKEPLEIEYDPAQVAPDELPDVVCTYECFGYSRLREPFSESYFARPRLLVKPKVMRVFRQQRVRGVTFVPVKVGR